MAQDNTPVGRIFEEIGISHIKGEQTILYDALGEPFPVNEIDGFYYPQIIRPDLHEVMKTVNIRDGDIIICSYPRSGQHWIWNIIYRLTHGMEEAPSGYEEFCMPELVGQELDKVPSPRVLRTHQLPDTLPKDIWRKSCKVINIVRHPKDVACSFFIHHKTWEPYGYDGTWEGYLPMFLKGEVAWNGLFKHILAYTKKAEETEVMLITFEECKKDTLGVIKKLAKYIGHERSEDDYKQLIEDTRIESIQSRNREYDAYSRGGQGNDVMYRQGKIGDWKNKFTVSQNEMFNKVYKEKMKGTSYVYDNILDS
ncbi:unnamed protein product [Owenia fusiformis]|uniref:Uncharacterized protein n=1 Tax=Owenia fusiformis TaxID=6347 RepID=A0A8J1U4J3_OWEFU|nr:unnamed protein product [Owenia fusiformis]